VLGVLISADLSLEKHVTNVSATCFHHLRRLRHDTGIRRAPNAESATTLVHVFVTSRVDYCYVVLAGAPKVITNKLQRWFNAAARFLTRTRTFDRGWMHANLKWLDVPDRVKYEVIVLTHRYHCAPVSSGSQRSGLRHGVKAAFIFRRLLSARSAVLSTGHVYGLRSSDILCGRSEAVELTVKTVA